MNIKVVDKYRQIGQLLHPTISFSLIKSQNYAKTHTHIHTPHPHQHTHPYTHPTPYTHHTPTYQPNTYTYTHKQIKTKETKQETKTKHTFRSSSAHKNRIECMEFKTAREKQTYKYVQTNKQTNKQTNQPCIENWRQRSWFIPPNQAKRTTAQTVRLPEPAVPFMMHV